MVHFLGFSTEQFVLQAFFYDWIDRSATKKGKLLPDKIGSMQYFLHGYTGALILLTCYT